MDVWSLQCPVKEHGQGLEGRGENLESGQNLFGEQGRRISRGNTRDWAGDSRETGPEYRPTPKLTEDASMNAYSNSPLRASSCDCRKPALSTFLKKEAKTVWVAGTCSSWTVSTVMAANEAQISREGLLPLTRVEIAGPSVILSGS